VHGGSRLDPPFPFCAAESVGLRKDFAQSEAENSVQLRMMTELQFIATKTAFIRAFVRK
jgi:hypothetical protein